MNVLESSFHKPRLLLAILFIAFLSACSLDAEILSANNLIDDGIGNIIDPKTDAQRVDHDFIVGETVTTKNGVVFTGVFGEVSEKRALENGVIFEGVFYE